MFDITSIQNNAEQRSRKLSNSKMKNSRKIKRSASAPMKKKSVHLRKELFPGWKLDPLTVSKRGSVFPKIRSPRVETRTGFRAKKFVDSYGEEQTNRFPIGMELVVIYPRCLALTKSGTQCKHNATIPGPKEGYWTCKRHTPIDD